MSITYETRTATAGLPAARADGAERDRAFRQATRHSRRVRLLRFGLPAIAIALAVAYVVMLTESWRIGLGKIAVDSVSVTPDDLTMKNPRYADKTKDGGHYEVRAKQAIMGFGQNTPIKLIDIDGDLVQVNNVVTKLKAKRGLYSNSTGELELFDGIEIDGSNGLTARLSRATVYSKDHRIISKEPVTATMPAGTVQGATMTMNSGTREATFVGDVKVHLTPAPGQSNIGIGRDARQPVDVTSDRLDINDARHIAHFVGTVVAVQGDSTLKTPNLYVEYEGKAADQLTQAKQEAKKADTPQSGVKLMLARGGVDITAGTDRRVRSDQADFDAKADTALFVGNVTLKQAKNVLEGSRFYVDRKHGRSRLDSPAAPGQPAGRIAATFYQSENRAAARPRSAVEEAAAATAGSLLGSFKADPNAPMDVEADTLDIYDAAKQAVFRGRVKAKQGDLLIQTVELIAHYSGQSGLGTLGTNRTDSNEQGQLTQVEARQKVLITSKDGQTATGDWANFDVKSNTIVLGGQVIVSRGKDVAEGPRLKIDLTTGMYRFELENGPAAAATPAKAAAPIAAAPAISESAAETPTHRTCPPGKQCLLFYPKNFKDKAKEKIKQILPEAAAKKPTDGWEPSTSASPVLRGD
ncbi:MAG TPA: LPS export ABC transporter periplasmic protein LptC [Dongiaceae bacterium]|nr:LPS export ABC transporter periplasmic protein LptC [Dongiaceae bacterium]